MPERQEQGADFPLAVKANQNALHRQIRGSHFQRKRHIPFVATDHEISHGRVITWTLRGKEAQEFISAAWIGTSLIEEVSTAGTLDDESFQAHHLLLTNLPTTPGALLKLVRDRSSIKGRHWIDWQHPAP